MGTASISPAGVKPAAQRAAADWPPAAQLVECPLCGYDQAGVIDGFRRGESWPMQGRCSECGLDWFWGDLLNPLRQVPRWFAENLRRAVLPTALATRMRALRPGRFWREVRVTMPIRASRLWMFVALSLALSFVTAAAVSAGNTWLLIQTGWIRVTWPATRLGEMGWAALLPFGDGSHGDGRALDEWSIVAFGWMLLMPLPFLVLRQTFMQVRVRRMHLLRIWAYSLTPIAMIILMTGGARAIGLTLRLNLVAWPGSGVLSQAMLRAGWILATGGWWIQVGAAGLWLASFWRIAIGKYLRLPHAGLVTAMMLLASFLAALAIAMYFPGSGLSYRVGFLFA